MATFTVTTTADTTADDGRLSLREALAQADAAPGADTVAFERAAMGGDKIVLAGSQLTVASEVTVDGGGGGITLDAGGQSRVLRVEAAGADVALAHLTVTGGLAEGEAGGGIWATCDSLALTQVTVTGNRASGDRVDGGGIAAAAADLTLTECTVSGNSTYGTGADGGGIAGGAVRLVASTVSGNSVAGNYALGGGIAGTALVEMTSCTIAGNRVQGEETRGGGVYGGDVSVTASTIAGNSVSGAFARGGGIWATQALSPVDSVVAGNSAVGGFGYQDAGGRIVDSDGRNIFGSYVAGAAPGDLLDVAAGSLFDPAGLADNGGPTETVALLLSAANPALDHGAPGGPATDQRGEPRPAPGQTLPDVGALELQARPTTLPGGRADDHLRGGGLGEVLLGRGGDDRLHGRGDGDRLEGGNGRDALVGGAGGDLLIGGGGPDRFVVAAGHSRVGAEDLILDFSRRQGDRVDLRRLDSDPDRAGDQELELVGSHGFDGAGQVRVDAAEGFTRVEVNLDGEPQAELGLRLDRDVPLREGDFLL